MDNPLMDFRLAYLRAIAKAWNDPDFEKELIHTNDILNTSKESISSLFGNVKLGYVCVNIFDDDKKPTRWEHGWIGNNDYFIINLPLKPENQTQQAVALASYYQLFPSLFGCQSGITNMEIQPSMNSQNSEMFQVRSGPVITDLGVSPEPFLDFGGVILRAISHAWKQDDFLRELTDPGLDDASHVLSKYLGFNNPWNFNLQFKYYEYEQIFVWNEMECQWKNVPKNVIKLHYPRRPSDANGNGKPEMYPIALTSYNETGPAYPFTCV